MNTNHARFPPLLYSNELQAFTELWFGPHRSVYPVPTFDTSKSQCVNSTDWSAVLLPVIAKGVTRPTSQSTSMPTVSPLPTASFSTLYTPLQASFVWYWVYCQ